MYNKIFSILTREQGNLRKTTRSYEKDSASDTIHKALVPDVSGSFLDYAAEQLIQCVRTSYMIDAYEIFDPDNRYEKPLEFPVLFESTLSGLTDNIIISYRAVERYATKLEENCVMSVDGTSNTIEFISGDRAGEVINYTVTDGLSEPIYLNERVFFNIKNLSTGPHTVTLSYSIPFTRTLLDIKRALPLGTESRYRYLKTNQLPDYIAGIVMDICYRQEKI